MRRLIIRRLIATVLVAAGVVAGISLQCGLWAQDCTWSCTTNTICEGLDSPCPLCDPGFDVACSDYQALEHNPAGLVIKKRVQGGNEEAIFEDEVVCFRTAACGDGAIGWVQICTPTGCSSCIPCPTICRACVRVTGWTNSKTNDYRCSSANCGG